MNSLSQHVLTPRRFIEGLSESILLLRLKWRNMRSWKSKAVIWAGLIIFLTCVIAMSNTGYFVRAIAQGIAGVDSLAQQAATTYLITFASGGLGNIGAAALGGVVLSSVIAPFTGAISTSIIPYINLASVRSSSKHRFTDSIFAQLISSVSILQFIALTTIASMLTIEGGRTWGLIFTWSLFPLFTLVSVTSLWIAEYLFRVFGAKVRLTILGSVLALVGVGILFDPEHGKTVFGLGTKFANTVQHIGEYSELTKLIIFGSIILLVVLLLFVSGTISSYTLARQERVSNKGKEKARKVRNSFKIPEIELFAILMTQMWRNHETRRPMLAAVLIGCVLAYVTSVSFAVQATFSVMTPIVVALAWGVNVFGILGSGTTWLSSQPKIFLSLPWIAGLVQIVTTLILSTAIWLPSFIAGKATLHQMFIIAVATISTTVLITRSSVNKAINSPYSTHAGVRGEGIVPPAVTLAYTFRFALWCGQYGVIILAANNAVVALILCFLALAWSGFRFKRLHDKWSDPVIRTNVISVVSR